jgi:DNA topoisomerase-1
LLRRTQDLPGQHLFEYLDEDGVVHRVRSEDVNAYLRDIAGADVTAKDFRTWAATVLAFRALREAPGTDRAALARRRVKAAVEQVADRLGNTATVCRSSYIHPTVVDAWLTGALARMRLPATTAPVDPAAPPTAEEEAAVLRLLTSAATRPSRRPTAGRASGA